MSNQNRNYLARLNADGTINTNFVDPRVADGAVQTLTLQPDGRILLGVFLRRLADARGAISRV